MNAGRQLDALVAQKVLGWRHGAHFDEGSYGYPPGSTMLRAYPRFSTRIEDAWRVWILLLQREGCWALGLHPRSGRCTVFDNGEYDFYSISEGATFPEAICLAAIRQAGVPRLLGGGIE